MNIEQRLEAVERSVRRWRRAAVTTGIVALIALAAAVPATAPAEKKVEGNFLSLVTADNGTQLVGAAAASDGGELFVKTSTQGKGAFMVFGGPFAGLMNDAGQWAIKLQVGPKGEGQILIRDAAGVEHAVKTQ